MARAPRYDVAGALHHVNVKAVDDRYLFVTDFDHVVFERRLDAVVERHAWQVLSYCALDMHVHLVLRTPQPNLGDGMRDLLSAYCQGFNRRHARRGHLVLERYHDVTIHSEEHLLRSIRYAVLNPVEAGLARWPGDWEWSSFAATAGLCPPPTYLALDESLRLFGRKRELARERYARFVAQGMGVAA
jgi:REP-associated tyrosine transposase